MRKVAACFLGLGLLIGASGCSETTKQEAAEAVDETGQAIESAAEDVANATEGAVEGMSEEMQESQTEGTENP